MSSMDLATWLRAQLDDDEQVARRVEPNQAPLDLRAMVTRDGSEPFLIIDSARVLAEINANRRMLDWIEDLEAKTLSDNLWNIDAYHPLLLLALPYADRPGYREEWRP